MKLSPVMNVSHECYGTVVTNFYTASLRDIQEANSIGILVKIPIKVSHYDDRVTVTFERRYPTGSRIIFPGEHITTHSPLWFTIDGEDVMATYMKGYFISEKHDFAYIMFDTKAEAIKFKLEL